MLPFHVVLAPGESPYRQVVFAATRAIVAGALPEGTPFPSVRELSGALKINPNTAHKVVSELIRNGLLEVRPGVGTVVSHRPEPAPAEVRAVLSGQVEQLVVEAKRLGLDETAVLNAIRTRWQDLDASAATTTATDTGDCE